MPIRIACFGWLMAAMSLMAGWVEPRAVAEGLTPAVIEKVKNAVVFLRVESPQGSSRGSAFLISPELLVTNAHVIGATREHPAPAERIVAVLSSGSPREISVAARVLAVDVKSDLAFLEIPKQANTKGLELVPTNEIRETLPVYIVGFPLGEALDSNARNPSVTIAAGTVSNLRRGKSQIIEDIQIDGNIIPGNSGGPIVDERGRVVAVSVATILGTGIGFSIPADVVEDDLEGQIADSTVEHEWISNGTFRIRIKVRMIDPYQRIKSAGLYYWHSAPNSTRPVDPNSKVETHGAPGDGKRNAVRLKLDSSSGLWVGEIPEVQVKSNEDFWIQPAIQVQKRLRLAKPNNYGIFLKHVADSRKSGSNRVADGAIELPRKDKPAEQKPLLGSQPLTKEKLSGIQQSLAARFENAPTRKTLESVQPPPADGIRVSIHRDDLGYQYSLVESKAERIKLGDTKLLQMVADPRGIALYAIFEDKSAVFVYDTNDFSVVEEISVARFPASLGCNDRLLAVACSDSKLVTLIDMESRKVVKTIKNKDDSTLVPSTIADVAPDGSLLTLWNRPPEKRSYAFLVDMESPPLFTMFGEFEWCSFPNKAAYLWTQDGFRGGSPSGKGECHDFAIAESGSYVRSLKDIQGKKKFHFYADCGVGVASRDGNSFLLPIPTEPIGGQSPHDKCRTLALSLELNSIQMEWPGLLLSEYPQANCIVTMRGAWTKFNTWVPEILFVNPSTGRIVRQVQITDLDELGYSYEFQRIGLQQKTAFVPGREIFLYQDRQATAAGNGEVLIVRCGPLSKEDRVATEPVVKVVNQPPTRALVGEELIFTPSADLPRGARNIEYRLKSKAPGMTIDPRTGTVAITPTSTCVGQFEIAIFAAADGIEIPVVEWVLEIDEP